MEKMIVPCGKRKVSIYVPKHSFVTKLCSNEKLCLECKGKMAERKRIVDLIRNDENDISYEEIEKLINKIYTKRIDEE